MLSMRHLWPTCQWPILQASTHILTTISLLARITPLTPLTINNSLTLLMRSHKMIFTMVHKPPGIRTFNTGRLIRISVITIIAFLRHMPKMTTDLALHTRSEDSARPRTGARPPRPAPSTDGSFSTRFAFKFTSCNT
ncbi:hypothetical protein V6Z12_D04G165700 [Gossypium hirsutum]